MKKYTTDILLEAYEKVNDIKGLKDSEPYFGQPKDTHLRAPSKEARSKMDKLFTDLFGDLDELPVTCLFLDVRKKAYTIQHDVEYVLLDVDFPSNKSGKVYGDIFDITKGDGEYILHLTAGGNYNTKTPGVWQLRGNFYKLANYY